VTISDTRLFQISSRFAELETLSYIALACHGRLAPPPTRAPDSKFSRHAQTVILAPISGYPVEIMQVTGVTSG
jgi:hypothetical protein